MVDIKGGITGVNEAGTRLAQKSVVQAPKVP